MNAFVLQLLVTLRPGGAERLALSLLEQGRGRFGGAVAGLCYPPGDLEPMATELGIPSFALRAETLGRARGILALYRLLRRLNVTLLHAQATYLLPYAVPAARLAHIPLIYTEHASHELEAIPRLRRTARLFTPFTQGAVCVSEHLKDYFLSLGIAPRLVRAIPNGVDTARFSPDGNVAALPWPEATPKTEGKSTAKAVVFGTVARLCEDKDHETLLRAFALVAGRHPRARLVIVGDGEKRPALETLVRDLHLAETVHLPGMSLDVPAWMRAMDVFVLSSKREGFPLVLLEALACGLPVISTDVGAIPSLNPSRNGDRENALLVPPQNPEALAGAMERLLDATAREERKRGDFARSRYGMDAAARRYFTLYHDVGGLP